MGIFAKMNGQAQRMCLTIAAFVTLTFRFILAQIPKRG
jgi:hypothetical protein